MFAPRRYTLDWPPESRRIEPNQRLLKQSPLLLCSLLSLTRLAFLAFLAPRVISDDSLRAVSPLEQSGRFCLFSFNY